MRRWSGHSGSQDQANAGADSPGKRESSKNRPDAHGVNQKELDTRLSQRRRGELTLSRIPALTPDLAPSPLPDPSLHLSHSLSLSLPRICDPVVHTRNRRLTAH